MEIDIKNLLSSKLTQKDIIINDLNTYPESLIEQMKCDEFCEKDFKIYFNKNTNYNVIGVHCSRLFDYEIEDIKINGLHSDDTIDYKSKINRMPNEFDSYKYDLLKYVSNPKNKRSNGKIYFDLGKIKITYDNIDLLKYWGGETLYCYYNNPYCDRQDLKELETKLTQYTFPCLAVLSVNAFQFFADYPDNKSIINCINSKTIKNYEGEHCTDKSNVKVIDVIPINGIS